MDHVHYDLGQIERDTRKMFEDFKPDSYPGEFYKKCADAQIVLTNQVLGGIMEGRPANDLFEASAYVISQLMLNLTNHFTGAPRELVMIELQREIGLQIEFTFSQPDNGVTGSIKLNPVTSGRA